ncbi:myeloid differentiation primary response protein MyD88-like [Littorina saxatilis]|uniref:Myeloid differentiation factor 88 n=1 Tax=Littorina saxatilis TaxID=31220 RepID=A0AAN9AT56_9CAEN
MAESMETDHYADTYLDPNHRDVSILALRMSSRKRLGMYLDIEAIPLHSGFIPNYEGLSELIGFEFIEQMKFQREKDHTQSLLLEWGNRPELNPTLGKLLEYLLQLERFDVLEDCKEIIRFDAEHFLKKKAAGSSEINPVQDATISQSPFNIDDMKVDETAIMTIQDVEKGGPTYYDAFVCYHPDGDDLKFVKTMIEKMECPPFNLKLFVPHRDDLPGASKHVISAKLIQDRCKRMVIVMSPRYLQSDACDFQTKFAHALSPGSRSKKLVPVLVQYCETPNILRHVTMCDYTRGDMTGWFWDRLTKSLQAPLNPSEIQIDPSNLSEIKMNIDSPSSDLTSSLSSLSKSSSTSSLNRPSAKTVPILPSPKEGGGRNSPGTAPVSDHHRGGAVTAPVVCSSPKEVPPSPTTERKTPKKKDLKSRFKSVFSSHSHHDSSNA